MKPMAPGQSSREWQRGRARELVGVGMVLGVGY